MAYKVIILYQLYMPSYFLGTFTEYPYLLSIAFNASSPLALSFLAFSFFNASSPLAFSFLAFSFFNASAVP